MPGIWSAVAREERPQTPLWMGPRKPSPNTHCARFTPLRTSSRRVASIRCACSRERLRPAAGRDTRELRGSASASCEGDSNRNLGGEDAAVPLKHRRFTFPKGIGPSVAGSVSPARASPTGAASSSTPAGGRIHCPSGIRFCESPRCPHRVIRGWRRVPRGGNVGVFGVPGLGALEAIRGDVVPVVVLHGHPKS